MWFSYQGKTLTANNILINNNGNNQQCLDDGKLFSNMLVKPIKCSVQLKQLMVKRCILQ